MLECTNTGGFCFDPGAGVWGNGEWVSWGWINEQIYEQELTDRQENTVAKPPRCLPGALSPVLSRLIAQAKTYQVRHGKPSRIVGELGERFVAERYGMVRHKRCAQGSDGKIGDQFIEVKTMTPGKKKQSVRVKREGHFGWLAIVRIDEHYNFEVKFVHRQKLRKGMGRFALVSWSMACGHFLVPDQISQ